MRPTTSRRAECYTAGILDAMPQVYEYLKMRIRLGYDTYRAVLAAFDWMREIAAEGDVIRVALENYSAYFRFAYPLHAGDMPRRASERGLQQPTFIIKSPSYAKPDNAWTHAFKSPFFEVLEKKRELKENTPLRFGLAPHEKAWALSLAREAAKRFFTGETKATPGDFSKRFSLPADVNVAFWVEGRIRGSWIIEGKPFGEGVREAARGALVDSRFKPLAAEELSSARIQVGVLHPLRVPLAQSGASATILHDKGYVVTRKEKRGWFLPEVFNARRYKNLGAFLQDLATEKADIALSELADAKVRVFEMEDFVEFGDRASAIPLCGPMPTTRVLSPQDIEVRLRAAADWLVFIQEADGNLPPVTDPLTGRRTQIDWVRLAFSAWALAEFGNAVKEPRYIGAAEKSRAFLHDRLIRGGRVVRHRTLTLAYLGRLALSLGRREEAVVALQTIAAAPRPAFEPNLYAQVSGYIRSKELREHSMPEQWAGAEALLKREFNDARKKRVPMNLAAWAELAPLFRDTDPQFSERVADWLAARQLESGAFPDTTASDFVYARGTGKVVEVLSLDPARYKAIIEKALAWLFSMQYTVESAFFIPREVRSSVLGAFRHDYLNQEAWIDAAGHVLLAAARLIRRKNP